MNKNLLTIAIVFTILFGAAFQCGKEDGGTDSKKSEKTSERSSTDAGGLTEEIVKRKITESIESSVMGVTGPKSVDVEFKSIKFGTSETPSEQDKIDNIRSDIYYPVRVKYTIIRHYTDSDQEEERYEDCKFFIDSYGEWSYRFGRAG
ncbi:hypothetical protein BH20ACI4_BH20ACI4_15650 [soil metagenome]